MSKIIMKHISEIEYENAVINISIPLPAKANQAEVTLNFICQTCNGYEQICQTCSGTGIESKILILENIRVGLGEDQTETIIEIIDKISSDITMS